jgi:hypothetical protein
MRLGPLTLGGLQHICANLRARDRVEMAMLGWGDDPTRRAQRLYDLWSHCWRAHIVSVSGVSAGPEPVAVLMLQWNTPTAFNAALLATERWGEIAIPLARHCRDTIKPAVIEAGIARVECRTWEGHAAARRFLEFFGARMEVRLPGYGRSGETFLQYAWTRPDLVTADPVEASHVQDAEGEQERRLAPAYHH